MKCPYCGAKLTINPHPFDGCVKARCVNVDCRYAEWTFPLKIWQALIDGKKAQSELNYYKGLNCPHVVEKQMQTITKLAKQLETAQKALKAVHDTLGLDKSDEELDKMMILPTGLHIIKRIVNQGLIDVQ